jgi:hypothetical protein
MVCMRIELILIVPAISALGFIATLVSGLYQQNLSTLGVSKIGYGFPLSWHGNSWIVYPGMPVAYWFSLESFVLDTAFWCLIFAVLTLVSLRWLKTRKREHKQ